MHLYKCRCLQEHLRMLLQSLRALCLAPGGSGWVWKYLEALVRSPGVCGRIACGFRTDLHIAEAAGVPLPQMPVAIYLMAIPSEETPAPVHATEEIPITEADNTINRTMDTMMKVFEAWIFQMSKANEPGYRGYRIARAYAIEADLPPPYVMGVL